MDDQYAFDLKRNLYKTILWISIQYKYKKESLKILSFIKIEIIVEKYRINFVIFHNGLLGGVNSNYKYNKYIFKIFIWIIPKINKNIGICGIIKSYLSSSAD